MKKRDEDPPDVLDRLRASMIENPPTENSARASSLGLCPCGQEIAVAMSDTGDPGVLHKLPMYVRRIQEARARRLPHVGIGHARDPVMTREQLEEALRVLAWLLKESEGAAPSLRYDPVFFSAWHVFVPGDAGERRTRWVAIAPSRAAKCPDTSTPGSKPSD